MNGKTVPQDHGYPARMLIPNIYGMKNVKWIRTIEVVNYDFIGYWQGQGWSDSANINTNARSTCRAGTSAGPVTSSASLESRLPARADLQSRDLPPTAPSHGTRDPRSPGGPALVAPLELRLDAERHRSREAHRPRDRRNREYRDPRLPRPYPDGSTGYDSIDVTVQRA